MSHRLPLGKCGEELAPQATVFGAEESERFQRLNASYSAYVIPLEEVLKLSRAQKDKEAYDLYDQQLEPLFKRFQWSSGDEQGRRRTN